MQLIAFVMGALIALGGTQLDWNYAINPEDGPSQQTFGAFSDPFISIQLAENPSNGNCLTTDGTNNIWSSSCGSGGGGSGGGTWSTTTSQVSGRLINYPNNATDIVAIGSNSTTTAEFWFDPNTNRSLIPFASSTAMTIATAYLTNLFIGADTIAEYIADTAGAMFTGNTESGITVTYQDSDNTTDFTVAAGVANLTSSDFGDWTCNGSTCTIDANSIALTTDTTGNYLESITGTANQISVANGSGAEDLDATLSLPSHVIFPGNFQATRSTTTHATSTNLDITGLLTFNGVTGSTWASFCTTITGGAGLCDGADATGAGGSGSVGTSTNEVANQVAVFTSNSATPALIGGDTDFTFSGNLLRITQASSTQSSCLGSCYFGATATSTFGTDGSLSFGDGLRLVDSATANAIEFQEIGGTSETMRYVLDSNEASWGSGSGVTVTNFNTMQVRAEQGTANNSGFGFVTDGDTGLFSSSANTFQMLAGNTTALSVTSSLFNIPINASSTLFSANYASSTDQVIGRTLTLFGTAYTTLAALGNALVNAVTAVTPTGTWDFGGATSLEIPNGSNPDVGAIGRIALDTSVNEFLVATSTAADPAVFKPYRTYAFSFASSTQGSGTTTRSLAPIDAAGYFDSIQCDSNSFLRVLLYDAAGNRLNDLIASSTVGTVKFTTNQAFTAGEPVRVDIGTTTNVAASTYLGCRIKYIYTRN